MEKALGDCEDAAGGEPDMGTPGGSRVDRGVETDEKFYWYLKIFVRLLFGLFCCAFWLRKGPHDWDV
jgi:hypothetical protein